VEEGNEMEVEYDPTSYYLNLLLWTSNWDLSEVIVLSF